WARRWPVPRPERTPLPGPPFATTRHWFTAPEEPVPPSIVDSSRPGRGPKLRLTPTTSATAAAPEPEPADIARPAEPAPAEPVPPAPTWDQVADLVRDRLAEILDIPSDQIAADRAFDELGLDSIFRMDLAQAVNRVWSLDLRGAEMYEYDTID